MSQKQFITHYRERSEMEAALKLGTQAVAKEETSHDK